MSDLQKRINQRKATRTQTSGVMKKIQTQIGNENVTHAKLLGLKNNLVSKLGQLNFLNDEVMGLLEPDDIEQDVLDSMDFIDPTHELLAEVTLKLEILSVTPRSEVEQPGNSSSIRSMTTRCRLPKFELPVFKGDPLAWQGFWDQFKTSIDGNDDISDIDRFNYLKRYLGGQALETISGLSLSSTNYKEAVRILIERYGNPQVLISAHMDCLIRMGKVTQKNDIKNLRKFYNGVENCTRNLSALKLDVSAYGSLLIPILKGKLPDELNMTIARRFGSEIWSLACLMTFFNDELTACENCHSVSSSSSSEGKVPKKTYDTYSASCLHGQVSNSLKTKRCIYCNETDHLAAKCTSVTNVAARLDMLRKQGRCFVCLRKGHLVRDCPSKYSCHKCKKKHHISICTADEQSENVHTNFVSTKNSVLLQTAYARVSSVSGTTMKHTRILFDSGSQRSYLSHALCKKLNLASVRTERVIVKTFGTHDSKVRNLNVYRFKVRHRGHEGFSVVEAYGVPTVCSPLTTAKYWFC